MGGRGLRRPCCRPRVRTDVEVVNSGIVEHTGAEVEDGPGETRRQHEEGDSPAGQCCCRRRERCSGKSGHFLGARNIAGGRQEDAQETELKRKARTTFTRRRALSTRPWAFASGL